MQIYLARNNQQAGPYTLEQLNQMLAAQQVLLTDLIWHQGMSEWRILGDVTQGKLSYQPHNVDSHSTEQILTSYPSTVESPTQSAPSQPINIHIKTPVLASRGKRIIAKTVDLGIFMTPQIVSSLMFFPTNELIALIQEKQTLTAADQARIIQQFANNVPDAVYWGLLGYSLFILFIQNDLIRRSGQSIGKKIFGLQIVDVSTYQLVSSGRAFLLRSFLFLVISQFIQIIPALMFILLIDLLLLFSKNNNTLHDRLAKTTVIDLKKSSSSFK